MINTLNGVSQDSAKSDWLSSHCRSHCLLGRLPKSIHPVFLLIPYFITGEVISLIDSTEWNINFTSVLIKFGIMVLVLYFVTRQVPWETQAKAVLIVFKVSFGVVAILLTALSVIDLIQFKYGILPYLAIGLILLPIWEFFFSLHKHHGKLTAFRIISVSILALVGYLQLES